MKLCRFVHLDTPDQVRAGLFFENRLYETDGTHALGVHELSKVRLLPPMGQPPSVRLFFGTGAEDLSYLYVSPANLVGHQSEYELPAQSGDLDLEASLVAVVKDEGALIAPDEASGFLLGLSLGMGLLQSTLADERPIQARDYPSVIGPFLITPDEIEGKHVMGDEGQFRFAASLAVNDDRLCSVTFEMPVSFYTIMEMASRTVSLQKGDVIASTPIPFRPLMKTKLMRGVQAGDMVELGVEALGNLRVKFV